MIVVDNLCKSFNGHLVLDHISFTVNKGMVIGLIGENGVGKSTLLQCLSGTHLPESGKIYINNGAIWENERLKSHIGYVDDGTFLLQNYRVKEIVQFFNQVYPSFQYDDFKRYNEIFKIPENKRISHLSKGMKTRLSLILHLSYHPDVLLLDEPTSGLDALIKKQVIQCIIDEIALHQTTVVIASHHLNELEKLCDAIAFLHNGKLINMDAIDTIKQDIQKLEVTFSTPPDSTLLTSSHWLAVEMIGNIYYFITRKNDPTNQKILTEYGGNHLSVIELSLEEIFTYINHKEIHISEVS